VEVVLATHSLGVGGSESYLLTIGEHLQRLGHDVTLSVVETGEFADLAADRGLRVVDNDRDLPDSCEALLAQDGIVSLALADRYPTTPQVFRASSDVFDFQLPPQLPGIVSAIVCVSERVARRVRALALECPVVRLRHPIDTVRFSSLRELPERPRRVVALSNYLSGRRLNIAREACDRVGLDLQIVGGASKTLATPAALAEADIVVAKGRAALEAMACGRATYVFDVFGHDGWVTPDSYAALEADGFAGLAHGAVVETDRMERDLRAYDQRMGPVNRDLILLHHRAQDHVQELVSLFRSLSPRVPLPSGQLRELAHMARVSRQFQMQAWELQGMYGALSRRMAALETHQRSRRYRWADRLAGPIDIVRRRKR